MVRRVTGPSLPRGGGPSFFIRMNMTESSLVICHTTGCDNEVKKHPGVGGLFFCDTCKSKDHEESKQQWLQLPLYGTAELCIKCGNQDKDWWSHNTLNVVSSISLSELVVVVSMSGPSVHSIVK